MDGYVTLKTKLDNKEIDKDIAQLEGKIQKLQEENATSRNEQSSLQAEIDSYEELTRQADEYKQKIKELKAQRDLMVKENPAMAVQMDTPELANVKAQITEIQNKYANATKEIDKQAPKIDKLYSKLDKVKSKQSENNAKITEYKQKIEQINTSKIQSGLNTVGKNLQKQISSMGKMAMAVIGIRTAWNLVRSAINAVTEYNDQVSTDFEYMRFCIANALAPAVQWLIQLLYTVLSYVNAIMSGWFGINLFSNSSAKSFEKMKKSAGGTAKAVKEIQKSLQGFDEMNVLQDNSGSQTGSSAAGGVAPSMDLSGLQAEVPAWLQWIIDNKEIILAVLAGITAGVIALKLGLSGIMALGIGVAVAGLVLLIQGIVNFIKDPSWHNFLTILQGIALIVAGIAILCGAWTVALVALGVAIVAYVIQNWETVKEILRKNWWLG